MGTAPGAKEIMMARMYWEDDSEFAYMGLQAPERSYPSRERIKRALADVSVVNTFTLVDDRTMDTVFECDACGEEVRTDPEPPDDLDDSEIWNRVEDGRDIALATHDCIHPCKHQSYRWCPICNAS